MSPVCGVCMERIETGTLCDDCREESRVADARRVEERYEAMARCDREEE